jgi:TfoX/Sxy family transcriptional regulator of competence genes
MASNPDFVQFVVDQCSAAGEVTVRKMFGDYGLYCNGLIVGLICDNCLYLKPTDAARPLLRELDMRPPYPGAKDQFYIGDLDDHDYLALLVRTTYNALAEGKKGK